MIQLRVNTTTLICLVLLLYNGGKDRFVRSYQGPRGARFTFSPSISNFYERQRFQFTCEAGTGESTNYEDAIPPNKPEIIKLVYFVDDRSEKLKQTIGCEYSGDQPVARVTGLIFPDLQWDPLTTDDCGNRDQKLDKLIITGNITADMQKKFSNFSCQAYYKEGEDTVTKKSENQLNSIQDLKVAPHNLTLTLSNVVEEGIMFSFSCESVGAIPNSSYTYMIQRGMENVLADPEATSYVPNKQDRGGINISCTDQSHINYTGPHSNIVKSLRVMPKYLEFRSGFKNKTVKNVNLSSILTQTYNLSCDIFNSSPGLHRSWSFNGVEHGEDKDTLSLNTSILKNGDKVVCKASFDFDGDPKEYSWLFKKVISDSADDLPWIPLVSGSVALGAVVIFAVVLVSSCKRKQQRQNRTGNRELPRGNHSRKSKSRTQEGRRRTGLALSPPDQPNQMDATDIANQLLQQQYLHDQERQRLREEIEAKEQILNAAHQRGRELEIFRQQHQQKEAENAFQIDDNYTVFITDPAKEKPSKKKRVKKKLIN